MTSVKQHPIFDHLVNDIFAPFAKEVNHLFTTPLTNIHETNDGFHIELMAPGKTKENFKLNVNDGLLTISYEAVEEPKKEDYKTIKKEFRNSSFKKTFSLEDKVDAEAIAAKYEDGILKVFLPKKESIKAQPKEITVL